MILTKIKDWIAWFYVRVILYYAGAALTDAELEEMKGKGDRWTFWFRRSKERIGFNGWLALVVATVIAYTGLFIYNIEKKKWGRVILQVCGYAFLGWFIPHILGYC